MRNRTNPGSSSSPSAPGPAPSTGGGSGTANTAIVGKWATKTLDFYQFDGGGSGSRGNLKGSKPTEPFSWITLNNQLILYSQQNDATKKEVLAFSNGSDSNSLYIRQPDGRYQEYTRM